MSKMLRCPLCDQPIITRSIPSAHTGLYAHLFDEHERNELVDHIVDQVKRREYERMESTGDGTNP